MSLQRPDDEAAHEERSLRLELTAGELEHVRSALMLLESTLGHEEADELREVIELLRKVEDARRG